MFHRTTRNRWDSCQLSLPWCTTRSRGEWSLSTWTAWWMTQWRCTKPGSSWMFGPNTKRRSLRRSELFLFCWVTVCPCKSAVQIGFVDLNAPYDWHWYIFGFGTWITSGISFQVCPAPQELWPDCLLSGEKGKLLHVFFARAHFLKAGFHAVDIFWAVH